MNKEEIKDKVESLGFKVAKVQDVWSNGNKMRLYRKQDTNRRTFEGERKMIAILVEVE